MNATIFSSQHYPIDGTCLKARQLYAKDIDVQRRSSSPCIQPAHNNESCRSRSKVDDKD